MVAQRGLTEAAPLQMREQLYLGGEQPGRQLALNLPLTAPHSTHLSRALEIKALLNSSLNFLHLAWTNLNAVPHIKQGQQNPTLWQFYSCSLIFINEPSIGSNYLLIMKGESCLFCQFNNLELLESA